MRLILPSILALLLTLPAPAGAQQETLLLQIIQDLQNPRRPVRTEPVTSSSEVQNYETEGAGTDPEAAAVQEAAQNYDEGMAPVAINPAMK